MLLPAAASVWGAAGIGALTGSLSAGAGKITTNVLTPCVKWDHNLGQAMRMADDIVFIHAGQVREHSPAARFFSRPRSQEARLFMQGELPWRISFDP